MESTAKQSVDYKLLGRVIAQAKPYRGTLVLTAVLAVVLAPIAILRPWLVQRMVDDHIFHGDIPGLTQMALLFIGVLVFESVLRYFFLYSSNWLGQSVVRDLRVRVFNHITSLRLTYFDRTPIGISTTRTISDIENINSVFSQGLITIVADFITVFVVLGVMFWVSWKLTLVCLITMPFLIAATYIFKEAIKTSFQQVRAQVAIMTAFLQERLSGMKIVQIFNAEAQEMEKFKAINRAYTKANIDSILAYSIYYPVVEIISAASLGLMVWYGARESLVNDVSLGALVAFPLYLNMLFRPIRMLADKFNTLQMGLVAAERVFNLLDRQDQIKNEGRILPQRKLRGEVAFRNVWFAYTEQDWVLRNVSFDIKPGETLAIVGSTGS
ncbi:MAG: ABC transporter transmembrane domain-containing protein, partial [Saprospiraceae bacterium]|nr:ABC transporter transmembrane domain-containing protein [Saprospiraceae bacterium]